MLMNFGRVRRLLAQQVIKGVPYFRQIFHLLLEIRVINVEIGSRRRKALQLSSGDLGSPEQGHMPLACSCRSSEDYKVSSCYAYSFFC